MSFSVTLEELNADPGIRVNLLDARNLGVLAIPRLPSNPLKFALRADAHPRC